MATPEKLLVDWMEIVSNIWGIKMFEVSDLRDRVVGGTIGEQVTLIFYAY